VKTNHFSKQQCADAYEFSVVYKVYFLRLYSLSANMCQSILMLILKYLAYILHFAQNYTVMKIFQFIYGISSDGNCCQWSVIATS